MSGFSTLEIGKKALLAQRFGLDVTSNNIANVNTEGYSRRVAIMSEDTSVRRNGFFIGNSVVVQKIQTFRNEYYDREIRGNVSKKSTYDVDSQFLKRVETTLGEPQNDSIDSMITDFFKSFDQVALNPDNVAFRSYIIDKGVQLAERFNSVSSNFNDLRQQTLRSIDSSVDTVNSLLKDIVEINKLALYNTSKDGNTSQQFADQRELKLQELAKFVDFKVATNNDNTINLFVNGINLISGVYVAEVDYRVTTEPLTNEITASLFKRDIDTGTETDLQPQSGEIFSYLKFHNELLDPIDSSGNFSISKQFNQFVNTFATKVNEVMITGFGMNDLSGPSPARHFFEPYNSLSLTPSSGINASTIKVNPALLNNPKDLPLSAIAGEPGNTEVARNVARIAEDKTFLDNLTPVEYYSGYIARIGGAARTAIEGLSTTKLVDEQLNTQRESFMGVNLDEEAVNLIKFQKGFEAASRIISMTNELLTTLINLGR